jgi:hypothetical protein
MKISSTGDEDAARPQSSMCTSMTRQEASEAPEESEVPGTQGGNRGEGEGGGRNRGEGQTKEKVIFRDCY